MDIVLEVCRALWAARRSDHGSITKGELKAFHLGGKRIIRVWEMDLRGFVKRTGQQCDHRHRGRSVLPHSPPVFFTVDG